MLLLHFDAATLQQKLSVFHPDGKSDVYGVWALVDKVTQQVILQQKNGKDPDGAPLEEINLKHIVMQ